MYLTPKLSILPSVSLQLYPILIAQLLFLQTILTPGKIQDIFIPYDQTYYIRMSINFELENYLGPEGHFQYK